MSAKIKGVKRLCRDRPGRSPTPHASLPDPSRSREARTEPRRVTHRAVAGSFPHEDRVGEGLRGPFRRISGA